ncbi:hypothetical protein [Streptomyces sp. NPDC048196]|uniref:hypothetical protein n=1 Tax=Streptomyces sp. NPDC048196 TaxID=3154712 RepID=UPI0034042C71
MTITDPRPAEPTDEARALLAEAAADYAANEENRRHAEANARADAADNGGT